jgi:hypothetical protein
MSINVLDVVLWIAGAWDKINTESVTKCSKVGFVVYCFTTEQQDKTTEDVLWLKIDSLLESLPSCRPLHNKLLTWKMKFCKFQRPPFWSGWGYGVTIFGVKVALSGLTSLFNLIRCANLFRSYKGDTQTDGHTDSQNGDLMGSTIHF